MSTPRRALPPSARSSRRRKAAVAVLISLALVVSGGLAYALWRATATIEADIKAGDFGLRLEALTWNAPEQNRFGQYAIDLKDLLLAPGQTLELHQEVVGSFDGTNLSVAISVDFPTYPRAVGTWYITSPDGQRVAPVSGDPVPLSYGLVIPHDELADSQRWVVVVSLKPVDADSSFPWVDPTDTNILQGGTIEFGHLKVSANQVRCGDGFTDACPQYLVEGPR
ncbi:MAG: hypothetical protein FWF43_00680 [Propionibacteriaceae bacterium]|nr:hypothetical protein [Propionibacteriaceae bacterium]